MIMECLIKRDGATELIVGGFKYRFEQNEKGESIADVNNEDHRKRLEATGFYRVYDPKLRERMAKQDDAKEKAEAKQKENPDPEKVSGADVIGLLIREFMPLNKDKFEEYVTANMARIQAFPSGARDGVIAKWTRLFPDDACPIIGG